MEESKNVTISFLFSECVYHVEMQPQIYNSIVLWIWLLNHLYGKSSFMTSLRICLRYWCVCFGIFVLILIWCTVFNKLPFASKLPFANIFCGTLKIRGLSSPFSSSYFFVFFIIILFILDALSSEVLDMVNSDCMDMVDFRMLQEMGIKESSLKHYVFNINNSVALRWKYNFVDNHICLMLIWVQCITKVHYQNWLCD